MFKIKSFYWWIAAISLVLFTIFTYLVKKRLFVKLDFDMTVRVQDQIPLSFDTFFSIFSLLGSFEITGVFLLIFLLLQRNIYYLVSFFFLFLAHVIEIVGKTFLSHPGPPFLFFRYDLGFLFPSSYIQAGSSYPSGHSLRAVFIAVVVCYFLLIRPKRIRKLNILLSAAAITFSVIMLISRVSLGEHWLTDVIGGLLLGLGFGSLSIYLFFRMKRFFYNRG